jgi:hypothetical protein
MRLPDVMLAALGKGLPGPRLVMLLIRAATLLKLAKKKRPVEGALKGTGYGGRMSRWHVQC